MNPGPQQQLQDQGNGCDGGAGSEAAPASPATEGGRCQGTVHRQRPGRGPVSVLRMELAVRKLEDSSMGDPQDSWVSIGFGF